MAEIGIGMTDVAGRRSRRAAPEAARRENRIALLSPAEAGSIAGDWADLAGRAAEDNHFFHPDAVLAAAGRLAGGVQIAALRNAGGRLIAAAPVTRARLGRIAPAVRLWSHDYGPLGVPLIDPATVDYSAAALVDQLAGGSLIVPDLPLDGGVAVAFAEAAGRAGRPVAIVDRHLRAALVRDHAGGLRAAQPTRRRKEFARQMRRLADLGAVALESVTKPARVRARFEEFLVLEAAGWKGRNRTALTSSEATAGFARAVVRASAERGAARIDTLRLDRRAVAMVVTFVAGATAWTWKIAYAEDYARFSPGAQLMLDMPAVLFAGTRIARIDSLAAADHPMIDHLWPDRLAIGTLVVGPKGGGFLHRTGLASAKAEVWARAIAHRIRQRLKSRGKDREQPT